MPMSMTDVTLNPALGDATVDELAASLRGTLLRPSSPGYDEARAIWNAAHDRKPALIVRCAGVHDVIEAVAFARGNGLFIAVRGGGHSIPGFSQIDGGLVIDLSSMRGVRVDPAARRATVQGGCVWHDVDMETQTFGLATTGGLISTTGVAGFTLGGGIGYLMRTAGLACDNLVGADVVTADGRLVHTSLDEEPELLRALRGGGGNFGVVTSFEFALHPVGPTVAGGLIAFDGEQATKVVRAWREWLPSAPAELTSVINLTTVPPAPFTPEAWHGKPMAAIIAMHSGTVEEGMEAFAPVKAFAEPIFDLIGPIPYVAMQGLPDPLHPPGDGNYFKSHHLMSLPDEAIDAVVEGHRAQSSPQCELHIHDMRGAVAREPAGGSSFPHRDAPYVLNVIAKWPGGGEGPEHVAWARNVVDALEPYGDGTAYVNFLGDAEDSSRLRAAYGDEIFTRLQAAKDRWDPQNVFRFNQNIPPSRT